MNRVFTSENEQNGDLWMSVVVLDGTLRLIKVSLINPSMPSVTIIKTYVCRI